MIGALGGFSDTDYEQRLREALHRAANYCRLPVDRVQSEFDAFQRRLLAHQGHAASIQGALDLAKPTVFELILRLGKTPRLAFLTQGPPLGQLGAGVRNLLRAGLEHYLAYGGSPDRAACLADCFRAAFPDMSALDALSSSGTALLLAFVPSADRTSMKAYFSTRAVRDGRHRERVRAIVERAGCLGDDFDPVYAALYDRERGARFVGVGVDFDAGERVKLYVRMTVPEAFAHAQRVAAAIGLDERLISNVATALPQHVLARSIELGVGLRSDGRRSLKVTYLFPGDGDGALAATGQLLQRCGYEPKILDDLAAALRRDESQTALHGVGIEYPETSPPKINLYLLPALYSGFLFC